MAETSNGRGGVGFTGLLQLVLLTLKLVGCIDWPWAYVLIPTWVELGIIGIVLIVLGIIRLREKLDKLFNV